MSRREADVGQTLPVEVLAEKYRGSFVVINVIQTDQSGWPSEGQFIGKYRRLGWANRRLSSELDRAKQEGKPFHGYVMPKEPYLKTVGEWRALLANPTEEMLRLSRWF